MMASSSHFASPRAHDVRFGSKADMTLLSRDVRLFPESGHSGRQSACPLGAQ